MNFFFSKSSQNATYLQKHVLKEKKTNNLFQLEKFFWSIFLLLNFFQGEKKILIFFHRGHVFGSLLHFETILRKKIRRPENLF